MFTSEEQSSRGWSILFWGAEFRDSVFLTGCSILGSTLQVDSYNTFHSDGLDEQAGLNQGDIYSQLRP